MNIHHNSSMDGVAMLREAKSRFTWRKVNGEVGAEKYLLIVSFVERLLLCILIAFKMVNSDRCPGGFPRRK
jgi:hypothetical protein